jgi:cytochrome P450
VPQIDLLDPASFSRGQPHDQFRWLREHEPVHRHDEPDGPGFWALTRHREVKEVGRDQARFSSEPTIMIADSPLGIPDHQMFLMLDPPRHTEQRKVISSRFLPRAVRALEPRVRELAARIVSGVAGRGECDLVEDVAGLMPSYVVAELLGLPPEDGVALYRLTEAIHAAPDDSDPGAGMRAVSEMFMYAHQVWEDKRAHPSEDLSSMIINGSFGGREVDEIDFALYFLLLVDAGGDTTRNLVAGGMNALFEHPGQRERLLADLDGLLPTAIEEMLRWVSPVVYMRRTATTDTEIDGVPVQAGDKVVMYYGAANRDPDAFSDADTFDVTRRPNDHVAFGGGGPHFCLGAHLGRLEIEALLREILVRLPDMEPAGPVEWLASNFISGPRHLPVRFSPP